ncbi:hypothetical protein J6590_043416 [Homalodisca vitripennis]|nr:hypothetical protein J6590_043416 [Homalodisca vitripennis]
MKNSFDCCRFPIFRFISVPPKKQVEKILAPGLDGDKHTDSAFMSSQGWRGRGPGSGKQRPVFFHQTGHSFLSSGNNRQFIFLHCIKEIFPDLY